jgi:hypothetical protein
VSAEAGLSERISFVDHDHRAGRWKSRAYRIADPVEKLLRATCRKGT